MPDRGRVEAGNYADLVLVDPDAVEEIRADDLHTKCDWTPFEGWDGIFPEWTMLRGKLVYEADSTEPFGPARGENVRDQTAAEPTATTDPEDTESEDAGDSESAASGDADIESE